MSTTTESSLKPGDIILATVQLRPETLERRPSLARYNGLRSVFLATYVYTTGRHYGEMALSHEEWAIERLPSGDVTDIEVSDEQPWADETVDYFHGDIIDFLEQPSYSEDGQLRRPDLYELRYAIANPGYKRAQMCGGARQRLTDHGLLEMVDGGTFVTAHGLRTATANVSCRTGMERGPQAPGAYRQALEDRNGGVL